MTHCATIGADQSQAPIAELRGRADYLDEQNAAA